VVLIDPLAERSRRLTAGECPDLRSGNWNGAHVLPALKQRGIPKSSVAQDLGLHVSDLEVLVFGSSPTIRSRGRGACADRGAAARRARRRLVR